MTSPERRLRHPLARLAGAQPDVLARAKTDRVKYTAMGGVLLTTAAVAGVSAAFALVSTLKLPTPVAAVIGALWAVVILNLDRMLIVNIRRQSGWVRNLGAAVPRILLAVVIGSVVSVPLVLKIFDPEITNEMQVMHSDNLIAAQKTLTEQFADIDVMQKKADELQAVASGRSQPSVSGDPDVVAAQKRVTDAQAAYDKAAAEAQCELVGSCGTHRPGVGEAYLQAKAKADRAKADLDAANTQLNDATAEAQSRIAGGAASNADAAKAELTTLVPRLEERKKERTEAQARLDRGELGSEGLLARLEALDRLTAGNSQMELASLALTLLFLLIEVLPVVVKLLTLVGEPTLYDRLLAKEEDVLERRATDRTDLMLEVEEDLRNQQIAQAKAANRLLVEQQAAIAKAAIETWGLIAKSRSDAELERWYQEHSGAAEPAAPPVLPMSMTVPVRPVAVSPATEPVATPPAAPAEPVTMPLAVAAGPARHRVGAGQTYRQFKASAGVPVNAVPHNGTAVPHS
ncbi:DUF4407 domain-containing protein [Amycolatopsis sp. CA-128772]|uniref:DUF4407 domain-containing protein n=1 Tax=Amycolatopsis sp. CA-128772 TaxID=2073159 RepID=UPI000CD197FD|nr:DUF4407 domain-containing protein [Amycolatopsis sp. CA-128772]